MCHLPDPRPLLSGMVTRLQLATWPALVGRDSAHGGSLRRLKIPGQCNPDPAASRFLQTV